jgi:hypothetical protein
VLRLLSRTVLRTVPRSLPRSVLRNEHHKKKHRAATLQHRLSIASASPHLTRVLDLDLEGLTDHVNCLVEVDPACLQVGLDDADLRRCDIERVKGGGDAIERG